MSQPIAAEYNIAPPTVGDGNKVNVQADSSGNLKFAGAGAAGSTSGGVVTVQRPEDGVALTKVAVTMGGSSATLVAASTSRLIVMVSSTYTNAAAAIDPTGGTAALDAGIPLLGGGTLIFTGKEAQSAMTQIGTNTQKLTVYTG